MIGYVTVGSNNIEKAVSFYDDLLAMVGAGRFMETDNFVAWAIAPDKPAFSVAKPADGRVASVGNGVMVALSADSTALVDAVYAKAIELGGSDEGPPGQRGEGFYAAYFRDLDGNKLNIFYTGA